MSNAPHLENHVSLASLLIDKSTCLETWQVSVQAPFLSPQLRTLVNIKPLHNVVFASAFRDRITVTGRKGVGKKAYWVETTTPRFFREYWTSLERADIGPPRPYSSIYRDLASSEQAPMRAPHRLRARR